MKIKMIIVLSVIIILALSVVLILNMPCFGRAPRGQRLERVQNSPHFQNGTFQNEIPTQMMTGDYSLLGETWRYLTGKGNSDRVVPKTNEVPVIKTDLKDLPNDKDLYVWFGHSSFLLKLNNKTILVDPVFIQGGPFSFINPMYPGTDIYKPEDMPDVIDYLVISHDHWDHLDYETVKALQPRVGKVICPIGVGEDFEYWGYNNEQIVELDWNEQYNNDIVFDCLSTRHFSGRNGFAGKTQRASWLISSSNRSIFYTGDGGYSDRFARFGAKYNIDLAIMENGQYDNMWAQMHTMPDELPLEIKELHPKRFLTVHHSKFKLAHHAWDEPRKNEQNAAEMTGIPLIAPIIGEVIKL